MHRAYLIINIIKLFFNLRSGKLIPFYAYTGDLHVSDDTNKYLALYQHTTTLNQRIVQ